MKTVIMGIDCGKSGVKSKSEKVKYKFDNLVLQDDVIEKPSNKNSFVVELKERYLVGNKVKAIKDYTSDKVTEFNKVAIYTAIAKTLEKLNINEKAEIKLTTGLPNEHYSGANIESLKQLLNGDVSILLNTKKIEFSLKQSDILVLPENYSVDYEDTSKVLLLDLGYRNLNINVLEHGEMVQQYMKHSELGVHELKSMIADELQKQGRRYFKVEDITDDVILDGLPNKEESKAYILNGILAYLRLLKNEVEAKGINLETIVKIAIRGGGTKLIKIDHLKEVFPDFCNNNNLIIEGDEFKNVEIFEEAAIEYFK